MTVQELIAELQKMPRDIEVYRADHDHGRFETAGSVRRVELIDKNDMTKYDNDESNDGRSYPFKDTPTRYVVVRP